MPLNQHGHPKYHRDPDGTPLCPKGLRMHPTIQFNHTYGYRAQRFCCPLLFPEKTGATCEHEQFSKGIGCVKDVNWEKGGQMRVTLDREHPIYKAIYDQRTGHVSASTVKRKNSASNDPEFIMGALYAISIP